MNFIQLIDKSKLFASLSIMGMAFSGLPGCSLNDSTPVAAPKQISGVITYRQPVFLTPEATVTVNLLDVSLADAPAQEVAAVTLTDPGQPPIDFVLEFDPAKIQANHTYAVRAEIEDRGRRMFLTDTAYLVLTRGHGAAVDMLLKPTTENPVMRPDASLTGTYWKLIAVDDEYVRMGDSHREAHLLLEEDGRARGHGGCNGFGGGYTLEDGKVLRFGNLAMTMMACSDTMESEYAFTQALGRINGFRITGDTLALLEDDATRLRFEAVYF